MKGKDDCQTDHLVGIDGQLEAMLDLLDYDFGGARCLGIHGPGGIGKTTLAKALFDKLISKFEQYCVLRDVSGSSRRDGLVFLQKKLLFHILGETEPMVDISDVDDGMKVIRETLHDKKVLIVLDDVDHSEQLEKLVGRQIVYEENLDPAKRSRLWIPEEAVDTVKTKEIKENIEALSLAGDPTLLIFTDEDFTRLPNLRFLELDGGSFTGYFTNLFSKLRWFSWCHCPPDLIATNLFPQNLVVLQLSEFNDANNWEGWRQIKMLHNLKVLQLTRLNMVRVDLSGCFTLERLIIKECQQLVQIDRSIGELKQLAYLYVEGCYQLKNLPAEIGLLANLKHLSLSNCSKLRELPDSMGKLNSLIKLDLSCTPSRRLPCSVGYLVNLKSLSLKGCREIRELQNLIETTESLIKLDLSLTRIKVFPSAIGLAIKLEVVHAKGVMVYFCNNILCLDRSGSRKGVI